MLEIIILMLVAIVVGSLPSGVLVAKVLGTKDPRTMGSKNIGAANMVRTAGLRAGLITFILDFSKGFIPAFVALKYNKLPPDFSWILGGVLVLSHCYSIFLGFRGGKGVATAAGVFFALSPLHAAIGLVAWIVVFSFSKTTSLAAIAAIVTLVLSLISSSPESPAIVVSLVILITIIRRHEENLHNLISGNENKFN